MGGRVLHAGRRLRHGRRACQPGGISGRNAASPRRAASRPSRTPSRDRGVPSGGPPRYGGEHHHDNDPAAHAGVLRGRRPEGVGPVTCAHSGWFLTKRSLEAGLFTRCAAGRIGRRRSSPPQFGQTPSKRSSVQSRQNVHSNEQLLAARLSGGRSISQHSQLGFSVSILFAFRSRGVDLQASESRCGTEDKMPSKTAR